MCTSKGRTVLQSHVAASLQDLHSGDSTHLGGHRTLDHRARCSFIIMRLPFNILFIGFLLAGQWQISGGQTYPKPSISAVYTTVVSLGGKIILQCASDYRQNAIYYLHKDPLILYSAYWNSEWGAAVFQIANARVSDGGTYTCSYCLSYDRRCSNRSDPVQVFIKGQLHPKPSITVNSVETLAKKGNVKISCKAEDNLPRLFSLYIQVGANRQQGKLTEKTARKEAVFAFDNAQEFQGGLYQCRYCNRTAFVELCSDFSDSRRINRINPSLSKPSIKVLPDEHISPGQNITIECQGPEKGLNFSLYKSGELITSQVTESERNRAEFPFFNVGLEDEGNYTCQYHRRGNPFAWSETSNATELVVRDMPEKSKTIIWASIAAGLLLLLLLLIFVLYRKRRKGSTANEMPQIMNTAPEPYREADPAEVSYAVLNHNSLRTKRAAPPASVPQPCVYATLAHDKVREGR
ncbi:immunoglobulin superfamily member 1-like [Podarcis raffonei]|uniref:immunoglobulin superfamily member 1-like n=1 Tax=Podarcis raffonei TaxID=65483 RepID=UPI002329522F|nr:immunoglobulin superfamily member 1-like [Podarcis raffonei]